MGLGENKWSARTGRAERACFRAVIIICYMVIWCTVERIDDKQGLKLLKLFAAQILFCFFSSFSLYWGVLFFVFSLFFFFLSFRFYRYKFSYKHLTIFT